MDAAKVEKKPKSTMAPARRVLLRLRPYVQKMAQGSLAETGVFRCTVRAALAKSYEFAVHTHRKTEEPYFATATLRGICEDLIVLSFLEALPDRDEAIAILSAEQMMDMAVRQATFFELHRKWQPTIRFDDKAVQQSKEALKSFASQHGWGKKLPAVKAMAVASGHGSLYEYLYAATSKWVHFSAGHALRTGWTELPKGREPVQDTAYAFSTRHFAGYYKEFNEIYGGHLFELLCRKFIGEFAEAAEVTALLDAFATALNARLRWPEALTFEELNVKPPNDLLLAIARVADERKIPAEKLQYAIAELLGAKAKPESA